MMLNRTLIDWFSKKQNCNDTVTYGSKFMAAKIETDKIIDMCYILKMLGVPISGPRYMLGDSLFVVNSSSIHDDTLKKKHNALSYHRVREAIAADISKFKHISRDQNPVDVLTNSLPSIR